MKTILSRFWRAVRNGFDRLVRLGAAYEKVILALLAVIIVISGTFWYRQFAQGQGSRPSPGGSYIEGVVADEQEMSQLTLRLTKTGFFSFDQNGELQNVLIEDWKVNPEKTEYLFTLKGLIDQTEVLSDLQNNVELLGSASVDEDEQGKIRITLTTPNPNLPYVLSQPLFDYGPYRLNKVNGTTSIFSRNPRDGAVEAFLNKVIIHNYPDMDSMSQALAKGKLDGAQVTQISLPTRYQIQSYPLPRYYAVIFNLNKSPFREEKTRQVMKDGDTLAGVSFTLTAADQEPNKTLAEEMVTQWKASGADVTLELKPRSEILEKIGPSRTFQALLTGIDYGIEFDPTYLWHSSQIRPPGNNLAGLKSDAVDQQISAINATLHIAERQKLIATLHETIKAEGAAHFIRQESASFILRESIVFQRPWLAQSLIDRYRSVAAWYRK